MGAVHYPTTLELIREYGRRISEKSCSCCGEFTLYELRYPDRGDIAYLCSWCDVEPASR